MARTQNTLIGRSSGSIGGVTFSTWKGINVAKSKATSVADPKTPAQLIQRRRMKNAVLLFKAFGSLLNTGFSEAATGQSAYNVFVSQNLKNGSISDELTNLLNDPALFSISSGTLDNTPITTAVATATSDQATVNWDSVTAGNKNSFDQVSALLLDANGQVLAQSTGAVRRTDGSITLTSNRPLITGEVLHAYLSFFQSTTRKSSDSVQRAITVSA
ncbi:MAG: DUF6266 family protein [Segetibacter sp.]